MNFQFKSYLKIATYLRWQLSIMKSQKTKKYKLLNLITNDIL